MMQKCIFKASLKINYYNFVSQKSCQTGTVSCIEISVITKYNSARRAGGINVNDGKMKFNSIHMNMHLGRECGRQTKIEIVNKTF